MRIQSQHVAFALTFCVVTLATATAIGQDQPTLSILPGMNPAVANGSVHATVSAETLGGGCAGYVGEQPSATVRVATPTVVSFGVTSEADTVLVLRGEGSSWCNDDADGDLQPRITTQLAAGTYELYVGTLAPETTASFAVAAVTRERPTVATGASGDAQLLSGYDPVELRGAAGGIVPAKLYGQGCSGRLPLLPNHIITAASAVPAAFTATSQSAPLSLVIVGPTQTWCVAGHPGQPASAALNLQPGTYHVFVGISGDGSAAEYSIRIQSSLPD